MATKKIRVYELARELGVENAVVLDLANELKIGVKSHSSSIDDPSADRVRRLADSKGLKREPVVEEPPPPKKAPEPKAPVEAVTPAAAPAEPAPPPRPGGRPAPGGRARPPAREHAPGPPPQPDPPPRRSRAHPVRRRR